MNEVLFKNRFVVPNPKLYPLGTRYSTLYNLVSKLDTVGQYLTANEFDTFINYLFNGPDPEVAYTQGFIEVGKFYGSVADSAGTIRVHGTPIIPYADTRLFLLAHDILRAGLYVDASGKVYGDEPEIYTTKMVYDIPPEEYITGGNIVRDNLCILYKNPSSNQYAKLLYNYNGSDDTEPGITITVDDEPSASTPYRLEDVVQVESTVYIECFTDEITSKLVKQIDNQFIRR